MKSTYEIKPEEVWDRVTVDKKEDGTSGGCANCGKVDGKDDDGGYLLDYYTDGAWEQGAGEVICPECYDAATTPEPNTFAGA